MATSTVNDRIEESRRFVLERNGDNSPTWLVDYWWIFTLGMIGVIVVISVAVCVLHEYCKRRWGITICPGAGRGGRISREEQLQRAEEFYLRRLADQGQRDELRDNNREAAIQRLRQERRQKYLVFLKPYTMVSAGITVRLASTRF
jgi:hypothetical protein